jgi:hypothetical protein
LSPISRRGTRPNCCSSSQIPNSRSSVCVGRDCPAQRSVVVATQDPARAGLAVVAGGAGGLLGRPVGGPPARPSTSLSPNDSPVRVDPGNVVSRANIGLGISDRCHDQPRALALDVWCWCDKQTRCWHSRSLQSPIGPRLGQPPLVGHRRGHGCPPYETTHPYGQIGRNPNESLTGHRTERFAEPGFGALGCFRARTIGPISKHSI